MSRILSLAEKNFEGKIKKYPVDKKLSAKLDLKKIFWRNTGRRE